jgi:sec-independent protein translocase protein TatB
MLGFAWSEIALIGAVALVVIGPKDLPKVMRSLGQWSRKLRSLASDFQRQFDDMVKEAELDELKRETEKAMDVGDLKSDIEKAMDVSEIKTDIENSIGAADIQKSLDLNEADAAADLPVLPPGETPPVPPAELSPADQAAAEAQAASEPAGLVPPGAPPKLADAPAREPTP